MTKPIAAKLVILRHGQTPYNKAHLMTGVADVPLTQLGEEQAAEAGRMLAHIRFDKVYSSTLSRAFNTAALALAAAASQQHLAKEDGGFDIEKRPEIVEVDTGDFTGRCHKSDPEILAWVRGYDKPLPNGESDRQAVARVRRFYEENLLPRLERGENVLVVVHAGIVRAFDIVLGIESEPVDGTPKVFRSVPNATPEVFDFVDGRLAGNYRLDNARKPEDAANQNAPQQGKNSLSRKPRIG